MATTTSTITAERVNGIAAKIVSGELTMDAVRKSAVWSDDDARQRIEARVTELKDGADNGSKSGKRKSAKCVDPDQFLMGDGDDAADAVRKALGQLRLPTRRFGSGSVGYMLNGQQINVTIGGVECRLQVTGQLVLIGSKPKADDAE